MKEQIDKIQTTEKFFSCFTKKSDDKYKFVKSVGHGGMKSILHVKDNDTSRDLAMAMMTDFENRSEAEIKAFLEEAVITASLEHPNIVPVHDIGVGDDNAPYFTMTLLKGKTLKEIIFDLRVYNKSFRGSKYDLNSLLRLLIKVCNGVALAHSKDIVHLDLKPGNIHVGTFGEVQIMDWGLARYIGLNKDYSDRYFCVNLTENIDDEGKKSGLIKGSPGYMAPEQFFEESRIDRRTDIYSLGCLLYSILTFEKPVDGDFTEMISKTMDGDIIPPKKRNTGNLIPSSLEAIALKAMALSPDNRYSSVNEMRDDLLSYLSGFATAAEDASCFRQFFLYVKRNLIVSIFTFLLLFFTVVIGFGIFVYEHNKQYFWQEYAKEDFTGMLYETDEFEFFDKQNQQSVESWQESIDGLRMPPGEWIWHKGKSLSDISAAIEFLPFSRFKIFQIALNCNRNKSNNHNLNGYFIKIESVIENQYRLLLFYKKNNKKVNIAAAQVSVENNKRNKLFVEKNKNKISVIFNQEKIFSYDNLLPFDDNFNNSFGVSAVGDDIRLSSIKLSALEVPVVPSPLLGGNSLVKYGFYELAVQEFIALAKSSEDDEIVFQALKNALIYNSMVQCFQKHDLVADDIKLICQEKAPFFLKNPEISKLKAAYLWRVGKMSLALYDLKKLVLESGYSLELNSFINLRRGVLSEEEQKELCELINLLPDIKNLNLSSLGFTDKTLRYLNLANVENLDLSNNKITDISFLRDKEFKYLDVSGNFLSQKSFEMLHGQCLIFKEQKKLK